MRHMLESKQYGVGLAAPQVGKSLAISAIYLRSTPTRPSQPEQKLVIINPKIIETFGRKTQLWEGCLSFGGVKDFPYAKVPRYRKVSVDYIDQDGKTQRLTADGLLAHVLQHEIDHLNGILFVDRVTDTKSYCMISEYKKQAAKQK